jgi:hypothetical protein
VKLQGRIPVESLDEERLTNIERRLVIGVSEMSMTPARTPRRYLAFAGAALAVAAAGVIGWQLHRPGAVAPVVAQDQHLSMKTDADKSTLALDDATITSDPATAIDITRGDGRVVVEMKRGRLDLAVQHRPGRVLVVRAGDTDIEDIGTRFTVDYDGASGVAVRVTEGEVKVTHHQQELRVAAGKAWTTDRGLVAIADLEPTVAAAAPKPSVPVVVSNDVPAVPVARDHVAVIPAQPRPPVRVATTEPHAQPAPPIVRTQPTVQTVDPYVELRTAIRKQPIAFDPKIDGKADAANEIAKLKKVAYSPTTLGPEASQALYQIAVLLHRPLGQDAEALHTLDMYRRRFSGGKEMNAAMWLRLRINCGHSIDEECRRAAYTYQHEVTTGETAEVAIRITNAQ